MKSEEVGDITKNRSEKEIIETWDRLGLLKDLNDSEKRLAAIYYEKAAIAMLSWDEIKHEFDNAAFG